jgi:acylphosphatase
MPRLHLIVRGLVQGVYFRASTAEEARRLGLTGWVRNLDDGAVELVAEGDADALAALARWAGHGPPRARVEGLEPVEAPATGEFTSFEVRR